ncbi:hypothetical protein FB45DRAFT_890313 [Roridomyces roridus]|uniref:Uncharacterized protein n=1 Tax=Roridomyces roridus TaxID=1738132 RepID=A0AAD7CL61_9AGAR|nr:hypothetical protein FB45DRAFT_890313 [Roridomyces roridus]
MAPTTNATDTRADPISMYPRLPRELERAIFELVALSHPVFIPSLMLLASRVKQWIDPFLYRTLVIGMDNSRLKQADRQRTYTLKQWGRIAELQASLLEFTRNLMMDVAPGNNRTTLNALLLACPNVQNLYMPWASYSPPPTETIDVLELRHLYCDVDDLVKTNPFSRPFFQNISHLELFSPPADKDWPGLIRLPRLTHLAFNNELLTLFQRLLNECASLRVLVVLDTPRPSSDYSELANDTRFVMMEVEDFIDDWQCGVLDGNDYWARAEDFIAKRIGGEPPSDGKHPFYLR